MRPRASRVFGMLIVLASWTGPASLLADTPYAFTDLTGAYTAFFDRTQTLSEPERIAAFKEEFGKLFPDFYGERRSKDKNWDEQIARSFRRFPEIRDEYIRTAASFQAMLRPALESFKRTFPDMKLEVPIYLLHSLGEMDGGTRMFGDRMALIFGADVMVTAHDFDDEQPFLHHELFHVYHEPQFVSCEEVWCALWVEGLATYVAHALNPEATDSQLLLNVPEPIRPQVDAHLDEAVCAVRARLSSEDPADMKALFSFGRLSPTIPPRAGYYVGYLAAKKAGEKHTAQELARMPMGEVKPTLETALKDLAECKEPAASRAAQ